MDNRALLEQLGWSADLIQEVTRGADRLREADIVAPFEHSSDTTPLSAAATRFQVSRGPDVGADRFVLPGDPEDE